MHKRISLISLVFMCFSYQAYGFSNNKVTYEIYTEQIINSSHYLKQYNHDSKLKLTYSGNITNNLNIKTNLEISSLKEQSTLYNKTTDGKLLNYVSQANLSLENANHSVTLGIAPNINSKTFYNDFFQVKSLATTNGLFDFVDYKNTSLYNELFTSSYSSSNNFIVNYYNNYLVKNYNTLIGFSYSINEHTNTNNVSAFDATIAYFGESKAIAYDLKLNYTKYFSTNNLNNLEINNIEGQYGALFRISYLGFTTVLAYKGSYLENNANMAYEGKLLYEISKFSFELNYLNSKLEQYNQKNNVSYVSAYGKYNITKIIAFKTALYSYKESYLQNHQDNKGILFSVSAKLN